MDESRRPLVSVSLAALAGLGAIVALAIFWHLFGWVPPPKHNGYPVTNFFADCAGPGFVLAYLLAAFGLGWARLRAWGVGIGMMLPMPFGMIVEVSMDPTNHNLFPFEVVMIWLPMFAAALGAAALGARVYRRTHRGN